MTITEELSNLLDEYFALGVAEGKEGRTHDTENGDAQRVRNEIEVALAVQAEPVAWMDDGTTRNGSEGTSFRVVTDETKRSMPKASSDSFSTPLYTTPDAQAKQEQWQPIETAPKDGTKIILGSSDGISIGQFIEEKGRTLIASDKPYWEAFDYSHWEIIEYNVWFEPTHWMPLPEPPSEKGGDAN